MGARVVKVDPAAISEAVIDEVVKLLEHGGIIGYPTETVYGLGGDTTNDTVVERIYRMKGRDPRKPLLLLVSRKDDVLPVVRTVTQKADILMEHFWPGPLTLVFNASSVLPRSLRGERDQVGVRISSDSICQALLATFQKPLVSTSANPAGEEPAQSASRVRSYFGDKVNLILDGGERSSKLPSTVLDVSMDPPRLLRRGAVRIDEIKRIIGVVNEP